MRQWFLSPRRSSRIIAPRKPARKCRPSVEQLEDRTVLQSGLTPNQAFVSAAYQVLLNRSPDSGGLAGWSAALDSGSLNRFQVAFDIATSVEFQTNAVQGLYQTLLRRGADSGGLNAFVNYLQRGGTIPLAASFILGSKEYFQVEGGGTNNGNIPSTRG